MKIAKRSGADQCTTAPPSPATDHLSPESPVTRHLSPVTRALRAGGLDLLHPFNVAWYNEAVEEHLQLPSFDPPASLGLLIGNTRAFWDVFLDAALENLGLIEREHPIETYVMEVVENALQSTDIRYALRWSHTVGRGMVAVQRLADLSGLARLAASKLSIHPLYGPWVAFRAVAVLDIRGPSGSAPGAAPACDACEASCLPAFRRARDVWMSHATGEAGWRAWLAVRESCPVGREYRYCDAQIEYHYTKDRAILRRALHGR